MFIPTEDGGRRPSEPSEPRTPATTPPPSGGYVTMTFLGWNAAGQDIYRGDDGKLYRGDAAGPNGFSPYDGSDQGLSPTPRSGDPDPTTTPAAPAAPPTRTIGDLLAPFQPPAERYEIPGMPVFTPPPAFEDPTMDEVRADAGYEFGRSEGQRALEASKAAGGVYNTGGTLKDILAWGNNYATQRFSDVRNRKADTYLLNYKTQFVDPYEMYYRSAGDTRTFNQRANEVDWSHAFDTFRDQRDSTYNKSYQYLTT